MMKTFLYVIGALLLLACAVNNSNISGTVDDTETTISLRGKVLNKGGDGVPNVVARLSRIGFADTTDALGNYLIYASKDTLEKLGIVLKSIKDTVLYVKDNATIQTQRVDTWVDTLPDVYIIQRGISGKLQTTQTSFKRIEAIVTSLDDTSAKPKRVALGYVASTSTYSGYIYFNNQPGILNYSVYVRVFNAESLFTGRSRILNFTSQIGDIEIPPFDPLNAVPVAHAHGDSLVSINDTIRLRGSAVDSFGGSIVKWEWSINRSAFMRTASSDTVIIAPTDSNPEYSCVLRVTDDDGNRAMDSLRVVVCTDVPVAEAGKDTTISINARAVFRGTASQQFGTIVMYKWDCNGDGTYDDSSSTTGTASYTYTHEASYNAKFYARDDDGNEATDVRIVTVANRPPAITFIRPDTTISIFDSIPFYGLVIDSDGVITEYAWDFNGDGTFEYSSGGIMNTGYRYGPAGVYGAVLRVTDDDNKKSLDTVRITVLQDAPQIFLCKDTTVSINDPIRFYGRVRDRFGKVVAWSLDVGNTGTFVPIMPQNDSTCTRVVFAPAIPANEWRILLKVVDDDGNAVTAGVKDSVLLDPPVVKLGGTVIVDPLDTIHLRSQVAHRFGSIKKWEWNIGGNGFSETSGGDTDMVAPDTGNLQLCIVMATDDDGNCGVDSARVVVRRGHRIAAGFNHSLMLKSDSSHWGCGYNLYGQLGDGTTTDKYTPVQIMTEVQSIAAGGSHSLMLKSDGTVWGCGYNLYGQLGDGTTTDKHTPVQIMTKVQSIAAGSGHSLMLKSDGTVWACGSNLFGQLGDGTATGKSLPVQVISGVRSIAAGIIHSLILKSDGTLWTCGHNLYGQLGDGTTTDKYTPVQIMTGVQNIAAGGNHSIVLKKDGTLWACGLNRYGQLGDGTTTDKYTPEQIMSDVQSIVAGENHSLMLKTDGTLWACGFNCYGQLGDGTTTDKYIPVQIMTGVQELAAGGNHSLILKLDGTVWACGRNYFGQLGNVMSFGTENPNPTPLQIIFQGR